MGKLKDTDKKLIDHCFEAGYPLYKLSGIIPVAPSTIYVYNRDRCKLQNNEPILNTSKSNLRTFMTRVDNSKPIEFMTRGIEFL